MRFLSAAACSELLDKEERQPMTPGFAAPDIRCTLGFWGAKLGVLEADCAVSDQKWAGQCHAAQLGSKWWEWSLISSQTGTQARLRLPWADSQLPGELTGCASSWRDRGLAAAAFLDAGLLELQCSHAPPQVEGRESV